MTFQEAKDIMGTNFLGPAELAMLSWLPGEKISAPDIAFSKETLEKSAATHILVFTPQIPAMTVNWFREKFGTDPSNEPCMYNQDWYLKEDFALEETLDGAWHLISKEVSEHARGKQPEEINHELHGEQFPSAITCTFTFFVWYLLRRETLWKHDYLWCSDHDHNGDRIYVGRYEDPKGVNKDGFNIHRYLTIRPAYSAAPEILA